MIGVEKEDLQYCSVGEFYIKVKDVSKQAKRQQTYGLNTARRFFAPTFLLGESKQKSMDADAWQKTCEHQLKQYYREIPKEDDSLRETQAKPVVIDSTDPGEISTGQNAVPARSQKRVPIKPPLEL